ncbi:MAG: class I SAM-dependent methyltransferase [Actinomycetota bacterium]|nr:class I SAM-dependent methyltransferase [Actinomycetota bacterium]MDP2287449.1 class I SAM-dependent methyltransferase [Actinomycetota bacterium]
MRLLEHPLTRGIDIDDPRNTLLRREIIRDKRFLRLLYTEWYERICSRIPSNSQSLLEIGSGAGFLREFLPQLTTSEVFPLEGIDRVVDATALDFADESLDAIIMTNVMHHIPDLDAFFAEAKRTLRDDGRIVMIEPWRTRWSDFVYKHLHHEPFEPNATEWRLPPGGPLSSANDALPWIVFARDRARFEQRYPDLQIVSIEPMMPVSYLASGGVSMRALLPGITYRTFRAVERKLLRERGAMFALIEVHRRKR